MRVLACVLLMVGAALAQEPSAPTQTPVPEDNVKVAARFDYDSSAPLDVKVISTETRDGAQVQDITYASPGSRMDDPKAPASTVPAYLVVPATGSGPFAAVIFGHWAHKSSPVRNRKEFLEEALAYAKAGVISLLIDADYNRPGYKVDEEHPVTQEATGMYNQVIETRRALDYLLSRKDVDPRRVAYVGHSRGAGVGGILRGVDTRFAAFVLMAGGYAIRESQLGPQDANAEKVKSEIGEGKFKDLMEFWKKFNFLDPVNSARLASEAPVFLQNATKDEYIPVERFRDEETIFPEPRRAKYYEAKHALNHEALVDRWNWLRRRLRLKDLPKGELEKVKEIE